MHNYSVCRMAVAPESMRWFELPVVYATASAKDFAYCGCRPSEQTEHCRLSGFWCGMWWSGSSGICSWNSDRWTSLIFCMSEKNLSEGMSYPSARADAIKSCCPAGADLLKEPNKHPCSRIPVSSEENTFLYKPYVIKRISTGYNSNDITGSICSASAIRHLLQETCPTHITESDAYLKPFTRFFQPPLPTC